MLGNPPYGVVGYTDIKGAADSAGQYVNVEISCSHQLNLRVLGRPVKPGDDSCVYPAADIAGIGSAVTDLIFSIANREVTFFSDTAPISFL